MRKRKFISILLTIVMVVCLMPTMAFAETGGDSANGATGTVTGSGTQKDPYVYNVEDASGITAAVDDINKETSNSKFYTISLMDDIEFGGMRLNYNTTTILGNGNKLTLTGGNDHSIAVVGTDGVSTPTLILGRSDGTDTLTLQGQTTNDCPSFFCVGNYGTGKNCGTLKMYDGVTIKGSTGQNTYGGAVVVGCGGYFEMNGGVITECGINGGSVCFGGALAVINGGKFTMHGGSIEKCFLNTSYCTEIGYYQTADYNLFWNYGAGAGVFVANNAVFKMTGGEIKDNYIQPMNGTTCKSYGVGGGIAVTGLNSYDITARVEITGGTIEGNHATLGGGGIAICGMSVSAIPIGTTYNTDGGTEDFTPGLVINGTEKKPVQIKNNTADGWGDYSVGGGGIMLYRLKDTNQVHINNAVISGNTATNGVGGGIESLSWSRGFPINFSVKNTTLSGNSATEGGGICLYNATDSGEMKATLSNTTITENRAEQIKDKDIGGIGGGISVENTDKNSAENTAVTFDANCVIYDNSASDVCADDFYKFSNSTVTNLPTAEQMSDYEKGPAFKGWFHDRENARYSETNAVEYTPVASVTDELELKVVRAPKYTVSFDTNDGSKVNDQTVYHGKNAKEPADPTYEGYDFDGWYTDPSCSEKYKFNFETPVTAPLTLYAKWKKIIVDINVDVDVDIDVDTDISKGTYKGLTFSNLLSSGDNKNKIVMIPENQKEILAKAITDSDFSSIDGRLISIELMCKVKEAQNEKEIGATENFIAQNFSGYEKLSYDAAISKIITVDGQEKLNQNIKNLPESIRIQFAVPDEWQNGTVKLLRAHTEGDEVTVKEMEDLTPDDKQVYETSSDKFSTYTLIYKKPSRGDSGSAYYYFAAKKIDAQDSHALSGAKFGLYLDGNEIATAASNSNGIVLFRVDEDDYKNITAKSDMYYKELAAPEGYVLSSDKISIEKSDLTKSQAAAKSNAKDVLNYRSSTPDKLNGDDHFAYIIGYEDGTVRPNGNISRAEATTIFFRLLKDSVRDGNLLTSNTYTDVTDDYWANTAISTMTGLGIVQGTDSTTFDSKAPITRAQFAAICARFDNGTSSGSQTFSDISGHWAEKYIQRAAELGWIKGFEDGTFRPDEYITRAEAMTMINRVLNRIPEEKSDLLSEMRVWSDCTADNWFYLAVQEATNSHDFKHKAGNYETWTSMNTDPDWTRYEK